MTRTRLHPQFVAHVYTVVRAVPSGRVTTYGRVAALIPPPPSVDVRGYEQVKARWVGYAMADCPEDVPWQRVVNAAGRISPRPDEGPELQRLLLLEEGVVFDEADRIDLARFGWEPDRGWLAAHPGFLAPADGTDGQALRGGRRR